MTDTYAPPEMVDEVVKGALDGCHALKAATTDLVSAMKADLGLAVNEAFLRWAFDCVNRRGDDRSACVTAMLSQLGWMLMQGAGVFLGSDGGTPDERERAFAVELGNMVGYLGREIGVQLTEPETRAAVRDTFMPYEKRQ
jgi:hypothetical protein